MTELRFTDEVVTETIEQVVAGVGADYVYPPSLEIANGADREVRCSYRDDHGGCIVGRVFAILAPELELIEGVAVDGQHLGLDNVVSGRVEMALLNAQDAQDHGEPFGVALGSYYSVMEREDYD